MGKSSIAKHLGRGPGSRAAVELGSQIRWRRRALGLTQSQLGEPLTKGFVSAVERGRSLPSLAALCLFAARLSTTVDGLLAGVNGLAMDEYTAAHEHDSATTRGGR